MSNGSLPQTIPPQTARLGTTDAQGNVTIDVTWYLLLYNVCMQVLNGANGSLTVTPFDLSLLDGQEIAETTEAESPESVAVSLDSDVSAADTSKLLSMLQAAQSLIADAIDPVSIGISQLIDAGIGAIQGDILYRDVSSWKALAPGTSGQFLETQGAAANPKWATGNAGNVVGPASATSGNVVLFDGTTGKLIKDGGTLGTNAFTSTAYLPLGGGTLTGNLLFTDATYDIGASGATRPRNLFLSGSLTAGAISGTTGAFSGNITLNTPAGGYIYGPSAAGADFNLIIGNNTGGSLVFRDGNANVVGIFASTGLAVIGTIIGTSTIKTADPGLGAGAWKLGQVESGLGLALNTTSYVQVMVDGAAVKLAQVL